MVLLITVVPGAQKTTMAPSVASITVLLACKAILDSSLASQH